MRDVLAFVLLLVVLSIVDSPRTVGEWLAQVNAGYITERAR